MSSAATCSSQARAGRDVGRRRRPSGPRGRLPPRPAEPPLRDPRRKRADRRLLAQALGLAPPLHARPLQRPPGDGLPRPRALVLDQGRGGRLPRGLRRTVRAPGSNRRQSRSAVAGTAAASWSKQATGSSRLKTWSWRWQATRFPRCLDFAHELDAGIVQLHSSEYRNASQLQEGRVLVVGVGNSGAEIAMEVVDEHPTWLAGKETGHVPFRIEGASARFVFLPLMFRVIGHRVLTVGTPIGRRMRPKLLSHGAPLVRVKPKDISAARIERVPRVVGVRDGLPLLEDDRVLEPANVVWCTGFRPDFSWIDAACLRGRGSPDGAEPSPRDSPRSTRAVLRRTLLPLRDVVRLPPRRREGR